MKTKLLSIFLLVSILLSACSQSGPSDTINLEMTDFAFTPNQFTIPAGARISLHITHDGLVEHDFVIMKLGADAGGHFSDEDLANVYWQIKVQPGEIKSITFIAPSEPGRYQIVCGMAGHIEAGMIGTLEVAK